MAVFSGEILTANWGESGVKARQLKAKHGSESLCCLRLEDQLGVDVPSLPKSLAFSEDCQE